MKKKLIALLVAVALTISAIPAYAFAMGGEEAGNTDPAVVETDPSAETDPPVETDSSVEIPAADAPEEEIRAWWDTLTQQEKLDFVPNLPEDDFEAWMYRLGELGLKDSHPAIDNFDDFEEFTAWWERLSEGKQNAIAGLRAEDEDPQVWNDIISVLMGEDPVDLENNAERAAMGRTIYVLPDYARRSQANQSGGTRGSPYPMWIQALHTIDAENNGTEVMVTNQDTLGRGGDMMADTWAHGGYLKIFFANGTVQKDDIGSINYIRKAAIIRGQNNTIYPTTRDMIGQGRNDDWLRITGGANVTIENLILDGTEASTQTENKDLGCVLRVENGSTLTLSNVTIRNFTCWNAAYPESSPIVVNSGGTLIMENCTIESNYFKKTQDGTGTLNEPYRAGAIYMQTGARATLTNTVIQNNQGSGMGGAIYVGNTSNLTLDGCVIRNNTAHYNVTNTSGRRITSAAVYMETGTLLTLKNGAYIYNNRMSGTQFANDQYNVRLQQPSNETTGIYVENRLGNINRGGYSGPSKVGVDIKGASSTSYYGSASGQLVARSQGINSALLEADDSIVSDDQTLRAQSRTSNLYWAGKYASPLPTTYQYYVSGSHSSRTNDYTDLTAGTQTKPFATVKDALESIRARIKDTNSTVTIQLLGDAPVSSSTMGWQDNSSEAGRTNVAKIVVKKADGVTANPTISANGVTGILFQNLNVPLEIRDVTFDGTNTSTSLLYKNEGDAVTALTLDNTTIKNFKPSIGSYFITSGAGGGTITLNGCTIQDNEFGRALFNSPASITNSTISRNTVAVSGGSLIEALSGNTLTLTGTTINQNVCEKTTSPILWVAAGGTLEIKDGSNITGNNSTTSTSAMVQADLNSTVKLSGNLTIESAVNGKNLWVKGDSILQLADNVTGTVHVTCGASISTAPIAGAKFGVSNNRTASNTNGDAVFRPDTMEAHFVGHVVGNELQWADLVYSYHVSGTNTTNVTPTASRGVGTADNPFGTLKAALESIALRTDDVQEEITIAVMDDAPYSTNGDTAGWDGDFGGRTINLIVIKKADTVTDAETKTINVTSTTGRLFENVNAQLEIRNLIFDGGNSSTATFYKNTSTASSTNLMMGNVTVQNFRPAGHQVYFIDTKMSQANTGTVILTDCTIKDNSFSHAFLHGNAQVTMTGCTISGNSTETDRGGASLINVEGTGANLTLERVTVQNNGATQNNPLIWVANEATLELKGGTQVINNNKTTGATSAAIQAEERSTVRLRGDVQVTGNTRGTGEKNLGIKSGDIIQLDGLITGTVGITPPTGAQGGDKFATGSNAASATGSVNAFSDDTGTYIVTSSGNDVIWALENTYVSSTGNDDTGLGTRESPFATIRKALGVVSDGGTIYVMDDITQTDSSLQNNKAVTITTDEQATATAVVTLSLTVANEPFLYQSGQNALTLRNITFQGDVTHNSTTVPHDDRPRAAFSAGQGTTLGKIILDDGTTLKNFNTRQGAITTASDGNPRGEITINDGVTITGNSASSSDGAGGVTVWGTSVLTMTGGTISNNSGATGGIFINHSANNDVSTISGGSITDNEGTNAQRAGGIFIRNSARLNISGASITGNRTTSDNAAGGVYVNGTSATLTLSGNVNINGNTKNNQASNVYLPTANKAITLAGVVTGTVGVTQAGATLNGTFATGTEASHATGSVNAFSDDTGTYGVTSSGNDVIWTYPELTDTYVSSTGNDDTGLGTRARPFATIRRALEMVSDGGTIYVMDDITQTDNDLQSDKSVSITTDPQIQPVDTIATVSWTAGGSGHYFLDQTGSGKTLTLTNITFDASGTTGNLAVFRVTDGTLTMEDGATISGNSGSGVSITGGTFTMENGATISGNSSSGVNITGGTFTMENGATISGNSRSGVNITGGTFTMNGGEVTENNPTSGYGDGVTITSTGTFRMNNGTISGHTAGSGVAVTGENTNFVMTGGTISGNSTEVGGGVCLKTNATFTMSGGEISGNTTTYGSRGGAGVYVTGGSTFTMSGGEISGNTANQNGAGVYVDGGCTFTMSNGTITNNTASQNGAGVYIGANGTLSLSGNVTINNNTKDGQASNVYLPNANKAITLAGAVTGTVGVSQVDAASGNVFAQGTDAAWATASASSFFDDTDTFAVKVDGNTLIWTDPTRVYIKDTGNDDTGLGTRENPYLTFNKAITEVQDGGTIYVMSDLTEAGYNINLQKDVTIKTDPTRDALCTIASGQYATVTLSFTNQINTNASGGNDDAFIRVYQGTGSVPTLTLEEITFSGAGQEGTSANMVTVFRPGLENSSYPRTGYITLNDGAKITQFTTKRGAISPPGAGKAGDCAVTMNAGSSITYNTATGGTDTAGGLTIWGASSLTMNGAEVSHNTGPNGGIYVHNGTVTITGSTISNNTGTDSTDAGGIKIKAGSLTIQGTTITNNTGAIGGIFIADNASVVIADADDGTGNTVTGNSYTGGTNANRAGGIYVGGTLTLSGNVNVTGNTKDSTNSNSNVVLSASNKSITLAGDVTGSVGVSQVDAASGNVFAQGTDAAWATASASSFFDDADTFAVKVDGNTLVWASFVAEILEGGMSKGKYTTLTNALTAYTPAGNNYIIQLLEDITNDIDTDVTIDKAVYLDLNGRNIESSLTVSGGGKLYGLDSATNSYQKQPANYGQITGTVTGTIEPMATAIQSGKSMNYMAVKEGSAWSFHRFNVQVGKFSFAIDTSYESGEIWFYPTVQGDAKVMAALKTLGVFATNTDDPSDPGKKASAPVTADDLDALWTDNGRYTYKGELTRLSYTNPSQKHLLSDVFEMGGSLTFVNPNGGDDVLFEGSTIQYSFLQVLKMYYDNTATVDERTEIDQFITDNALDAEWGNV